MASVRCKIKSPTQLVSGPGKTGKKLPIIPKTIKIEAAKTKSISINIFLYDALKTTLLQNL
jgi:hypothetical protein